MLFRPVLHLSVSVRERVCVCVCVVSGDKIAQFQKLQEQMGLYQHKSNPNHTQKHVNSHTFGMYEQLLPQSSVYFRKHIKLRWLRIEKGFKKMAKVFVWIMHVCFVCICVCVLLSDGEIRQRANHLELRSRPVHTHTSSDQALTSS